MVVARVKILDWTFEIDEDLRWTETAGSPTSPPSIFLRILREAYGPGWHPPLLAYEPVWAAGAAREAARELNGTLLPGDGAPGDASGETIY